MFRANGTLRDWDIEERLGEIRDSTLITSGRFGVMTPAVSRRLDEGIPNSEWVLFENSSHVAFAEESEKYIQMLDKFLNKVEEKLMYMVTVNSRKR